MFPIHIPLLCTHPLNLTRPEKRTGNQRQIEKSNTNQLKKKRNLRSPIRRKVMEPQARESKAQTHNPNNEIQFNESNKKK